MRIVNLKLNPLYISPYVQLRNHYKDLLMTDPVTIEQTQKWLKSQDVEVRIIVEKNEVLGAIVLYLNKDNEIAIFVKKRGIGLGAKLLKAIIDIAHKRNILYLRAIVRVDNLSAQRFFIKNGFVVEKEYIKLYKNNKITVTEFIRKIR